MKAFRSVLFVLIWLGMLAAEVFAAMRLWRLAVLPLSYKLLMCVVLFSAWLVAGLLFLWGSKAKKGKHPGLARRIIAWLLAVVMAGGSLYSTRVADQLDQTIEEVTQEVKVSSVVAVYVLADDPAEDLEDAEGYTFGTTQSYDAANTRTAVKDLKTHFDNLKTESFQTVLDMVDALYQGDVGAMILNEAYASILEDLDDYETFSEDTRILYEISIDEADASQILDDVMAEEPKDEAESETDGESTAVEVGTYNTAIENFRSVNVTQEPFVVYVSGSDTRSKMLATSRSDVNILIAVNPRTKQILMLSTPRDYYVPNPAGGGAMDKLTHCGIYGIGCSAGALSNLYSVPVNYYAQINFTGFETLIDAVGGVTVYSDYAFTSKVGHYSFSQGENHLNGSQALGFVRERYSFASGDRQRGKNQMLVLSAVIKKLSAGTILTRHAQILSSMQGMFVTNLSADDISSLVKMQLSDGADWNVKSFSVTGGDGSNYTYSMPRFRAYVMYQDKGLVSRASGLMQRVLNGETLTDADVAS